MASKVIISAIIKYKKIINFLIELFDGWLIELIKSLLLNFIDTKKFKE